MWSRKPMPVEIDRDLDVGFLGGALDRAFAHETSLPRRVCARLVSRVGALRYCSTIFELLHRSMRKCRLLSVRETLQAPDFALRLVRVSGTFMKYEWNDAKAAANFVRHDTSFRAAARGLADTRKVERIDDRFDYGEERIQTLCMDRGHILFVVTVVRGNDVCRIVSARKANRNEQEKYFKGHF